MGFNRLTSGLNRLSQSFGIRLASSGASVPADALLAEDGQPLLTESGEFILI